MYEDGQLTLHDYGKCTDGTCHGGGSCYSTVMQCVMKAVYVYGVRFSNDGCAYRVQHRGSVNVMRPTCSISRRR